MPFPKSFLTLGLAATSAGALAGFLRSNRFESDEQLNPEEIKSKQASTLGIGATTTAGVLGLTWFAAARSHNPTLNAIGAAIAAGGAYATARTYEKLETQRLSVSGEESSLGTQLLKSTAGLGTLWYGGRAIAPYVARSVARFDQQFRPWASALTETIEQTQLGNLGNFASRFEKSLNLTREVYNNSPERFPVQNYLSMIGRVKKELSNTDLSITAQKDAVQGLIKKYSIRSNEAINGLRSATLADAVRAGHPLYGLEAIERAAIDLSTISLGKGVLFDTTNSKIMNLYNFTPGKMIADAMIGFTKHTQMPILNFNPLQLFRPKEFIGAVEQGTQFHIFKPGSPIGPGQTAGSRGTAFISGKLYDIATGKPLSKGGILIKTGEYHTPEGGTKEYRETVFGEILRKRQYRGKYPNPPPNQTWWQKTLNTLEMDIPFIHKTGYAETPSRIEKLAHPIVNKLGKRGFFDSIKSTLKSVVGSAEFEELKPSAAGKDVFTSTAKSFKKAGKDITSEAAFGFVPYSDLPGTTAFWLANRPTRLMEDLGLGNFNPETTHSAADVVWKMFFKRFLPIYASYQMLQATNDLSRNLIGYGPSDLASDALAGINVGSAYLRDVLGITDIAKYLEELMPGFISSSGMSTIRGAGLPLVAGAYAGKAGFFAGLAGSIFLGGSSTRALTLTGDETKEEYFGYKRIPVRSGRWWMFGSTEFMGGKVKYFAPNWYKRSRAHAEFTDVQYGSEFEYWSNIMDPYHYAIKHYSDRPYPIVTSGTQDLPFVGPMVGGMFSPAMTMHQNELMGGGNGQGYGSSYSNDQTYGINGSAGFSQEIAGGGNIPAMSEQLPPYGTAMGLGGLPPPGAVRPDSLSARAGEQIYRGTEYLGIYGFMVNSLNSNLTGDQDFFTGPQLESANRIAGAERSYWDQNIGDPFGTTELFRRFIPHRRRQIDLINPIPNTMPGWMPGQEYFINFHQGDPYTKVELGESRLPGSGYEKFYTPGSGIVDAAKQLGMANLDAAQGQSPYSIMDTYRILGNIAPYSNQYKYSAEYIMAMSKAGMLTPEADAERKYLKKEITQTKRRYSFKPRTFTRGNTTTEVVTVDKYLGAGRFSVQGKEGEIYDLAGVKGITNKGEKRIQSLLETGKTLSVQVLDDERYKRKTTTVVPTTPVVIGDLNSELIRRKEGEYKKTGPADIFSPLNHKVKYDIFERSIGSLWENFSHMDTPLHTKFLHNRTALEEWERTQLYGRDSADWTHPIRDFLMPLRDKLAGRGPITGAVVGSFIGSLFGTSKSAKVLLGMSGGLFGGMTAATKWGAAIPEYRKKEWEIDKYFDILEYLKYQRLYSYTRNLAIEKEGVDPEAFSKSLNASRLARKNISKQIEMEYGTQSLEQLGTEGEDKKKIKQSKQSLKAGLNVLARQKWTEDAAVNSLKGTLAGQALNYKQMAMSTMYGADPAGDFASIMRALPVKQREFFSAFMQAPADEREAISKKVPLGMRRFLQAKWGEEIEENPNLEEYFQDHYLPGESWVGWHPAVNLNDIEYKTVKQEGFDQHDFNMWDTQGEEIKRRPYIPLIDPFSNKGNPQLIKQELRDIISAQGYNNYEMYVTDNAGSAGMSLDFDVKYATDPEARNYIKNNLNTLMAPSYVS